MTPRRRRVVLKGWACVGTHGHIYFASTTPLHPQCEGKLEIFVDKKSALKNALTPDHVREVHIVMKARKA